MEEAAVVEGAELGLRLAVAAVELGSRSPRRRSPSPLQKRFQALKVGLSCRSALIPPPTHAPPVLPPAPNGARSIALPPDRELRLARAASQCGAPTNGPSLINGVTSP